MPAHQFTTPRVVYLGLAYGEKTSRERGAAGNVARSTGGRPAHGGPTGTTRRAAGRPPAAVLR